MTPTPEIADAVNRATSVLADVGALVQEDLSEAVPRGAELFKSLFAADGRAGFEGS